MDDHQERDEFEAEIRKLDVPKDALDRWPDGRYIAEPIEDYWTGWKMARRSSPSTQAAQAAVQATAKPAETRMDTAFEGVAPSTQRQGEGWGPINTVGDMVRNLLTLDQAAPIHAAFHMSVSGERKCRTYPLVISRERVIDGKWIDSSRKDVPYEHVVWAKPDERQGEEARDAAGRDYADPELACSSCGLTMGESRTLGHIKLGILHAARATHPGDAPEGEGR